MIAGVSRVGQWCNGVEDLYVRILLFSHRSNYDGIIGFRTLVWAYDYFVLCLSLPVIIIQ